MKNIAIFASGAGTNAENIIKYFSNKKSAQVTLVLSNKRQAAVHKRAEALKVSPFFSTVIIFMLPGMFLNC